MCVVNGIDYGIRMVGSIMNQIKRLLVRHGQPVLFLVWLWALVSLLLNEQYVLFLRPEFAWVLILAVGILLGFMKAGWQEQRSTFGVAEALRFMVLVLPLLYLYNSRGISLDAKAFRNRSLALPVIQATKLLPVPSTPKSGDPDSDTDVQLHEITLADLYRVPERYTNQRVKLIGRYHRDERAIRDLGSRVRVVFRFSINCCAADATPLAVLADVNEATLLEDIDESVWVEVEGIFYIKEKADRRLPLLENATIQPTAPPRRPYLF